jgi:regulator of protease activity HflC (stomatin/prohibitin superfamily)
VILTREIQKRADEQGLGVEIVFVGLQGIHPPPEVAGDYQNVIGSFQKKQAAILRAQGDRNRILGTLAGSAEEADELYELASKYIAAERKDEKEKKEVFGKKLDKAFQDAEGDIFATLRESQAYAYEKAVIARAVGLRFQDQIKAYNASRSIFTRFQRLNVLEDEELQNIRKYIIAPDKDNEQIFIIDLKEKLTPSLYDISGFEENKQK